ncbi:uncharacterized protein G2W53_043107 [Senna tora]|uniref:Uncharacterized protein n=1 Tax=Senna tora TaxID=362788 RepID=A0A834SIB9_9FABA|nr:uncharacterized protein G2W53_043107 [Senna tora]
MDRFAQKAGNPGIGKPHFLLLCLKLFPFPFYTNDTTKKKEYEKASSFINIIRQLLKLILSNVHGGSSPSPPGAMANWSWSPALPRVSTSPKLATRSSPRLGGSIALSPSATKSTSSMAVAVELDVCADGPTRRPGTHLAILMP